MISFKNTFLTQFPGPSRWNTKILSNSLIPFRHTFLTQFPEPWRGNAQAFKNTFLTQFPGPWRGNAKILLNWLISFNNTFLTQFPGPSRGNTKILSNSLIPFRNTFLTHWSPLKTPSQVNFLGPGEEMLKSFLTHRFPWKHNPNLICWALARKCKHLF